MPSKSDKTRERILEATVYCITHIGVERTSHAQIANRAKVSRSLIAHYFPSKRKMFPAVIRHVAEDAYRYFRESLPENNEANGAKGLILARLEMNLRYFTLKPDHYKCIVLLYYQAAIDRSYRKMNTVLVETAVNGLEEPLKELLSSVLARRAAESLHNELIASIQKYYMTEHAEDAETFVRRMIRHFSERLDALTATRA